VLAVWLITIERLKEADCDVHDVKRLEYEAHDNSRVHSLEQVIEFFMTERRLLPCVCALYSSEIQESGRWY